jgi:hypothetical protein
MAIGSFGDTSLLDELKVSNEKKRWTGSNFLKHFGSKPRDVVKALLRQVGDSNATNRLGAVLALGKLGPDAKDAVPQLKKALKDPNAVVRAALEISLSTIEPKRAQDLEKIGKHIAAIVEDLKDDGNDLDPDKLIQLYILVSHAIHSGFFGDKMVKNQIQKTMSWARQGLDNLPPMSVPALVRGINCTAQSHLGFTEPFSCLNLKLRTLVQDSEDVPSLSYAAVNLGAGISEGSPFWATVQRMRSQILTNSTFLDRMILELQQSILAKKQFVKTMSTFVTNKKDLTNLLSLVSPICHGDHISPHFKQFQKNQVDLQYLLFIKTQKMFSKTQDVFQQMWNKPNPFIVEKLKDADPLVRWVAVNIISRKRIPAEKELIELLSDPVAEVREAAHQALVRLSRGTDFGPRLMDSPAKIQQASKRWTAWLEMQEPSMYRPGSSAEPSPDALENFQFIEKKKVEKKKK